MSNTFSQVEKFSLNINAITLLKEIESRKSEATLHEVSVLKSYSGWGGIFNVFPNSMNEFVNDVWAERNQQLKNVLTETEYKSAQESIVDAFYTPTKIVSAMWDIVDNLGLSKGVVLEPSCGTGVFLHSIKPNTFFRFVGAEKDSISARIAKQINHANSYIFNTDFEKLALPENSVDLAIGNPPYGDFKAFFKHSFHLNSFSIHNQFILNSLQALRAGGLGVFVVSRYLMDSSDHYARSEMAKLGELLGAFRLPSSTFKSEANTEVVADILVFRRYSEHQEHDYINNLRNGGLPKPWVKNLIHLGEESDIRYNTIFADSSNVGGNIEIQTCQFGYTLDVVDNGTLDSKLAAWTESFKLAEQCYSPTDNDIVQAAFDNLVAHLYIELSGKEVGVIDKNEVGELYRIVEQELNGSFLYKTQILDENTVWSDRYILDVSGNYYENIPKLNELGEKVYLTDDYGCLTTRLEYEKKFISIDEISSRSKLGVTRFKKIEALVQLRDCLVRQINLEMTDDLRMEKNRIELNRLYEKYVKKFGFLLSSGNEALINSFPDGGLLQSLEHSYVKPVKELSHIDDSGKKVYRIIKVESSEKSAILTKRVVYKKAEPDTAADAIHSLSLSLGHKGCVDIEYMAGLLKTTEQQVIDDLYTNLDKPKIFFDVEQGGWIHHSLFLSGNVASKLEVHKKNDANIKTIAALENVQPEPISIENINLSIGQVWIPQEYYTQFVQYITDDANAIVRYERVSNLYNVTCSPSQVKSTIYATSKYDLQRLLESVLNKATIRITYTETVLGKTKTIFDQEATEQATMAADGIKNEFFDWLYAQPEKLEHLESLYNATFNNFVVPKFDGSHLTLKGKVPDDIITMRPHQLNAVYRGIASNAGLLDHSVGSGKTFSGISIAMERKQLGLSNKALIVVPNHLINQFTADVYRLYPTAKVLAATKKDCEKRNRKRLFARVATGDYDIVIMAHSSFEFLKLSETQQNTYIEEEIKVLQEALAEEQQYCNNGVKTRSAKNLATKLRKLEAKFCRIVHSSRKDRILSFEQLGFDLQIIDEAHLYKNLFYNTNLTNIAGMGNPSGSNKALDIFFKTKYLLDNGGSVFFLTGTPISNSAVEMHVMMRYLMLDTLKELNIDNFDNWAKIYTENTTKFEATESGKLKQVTRFARNWNNMSSLMQLWYQITDCVTNDDLERDYFAKTGCHFPIPRVKDGGRQAIAVEPTLEQNLLLDEVLQAFNDLENISDTKERNAERLRLMDKARKLSLAARCVDSNKYSSETGGKLEAVAQNVYASYLEWNEHKGTQLIFLDRSVPKSNQDEKIIKEYDSLMVKYEQALNDENDALVNVLEDRLDRFNPSEIEELRVAQYSNWNAYDEIKNQLVQLGIPSHEVRFIQEAKNDQQKQDIFDLVKSGEIRVLIGSTQRMGAGTNVQDRLVHLHHADVTWKPSDIEQREGRIIRQGNILYELLGHDNFEASISAYVCERTVDAKLWEVNSAKLKMINAIRNYTGQHTLDFGEDADSISMQEIAALASGNPLMLERVELDADIQAIKRQRSTYQRKLSSMQIQCTRAKATLEHEPLRLESYRASKPVYLARLQETKKNADSLSVEVNQKVFTDSTAASNYVSELAHKRMNIVVNGDLLSMTKAKDLIAVIFAPVKLFDFTDTFGNHFNSVGQVAVEVLADIANSNTSFELGYLFGLPVSVILDYKTSLSGQKYTNQVLTISTNDKKIILADVILSEQLSKYNLASSLIKLKDRLSDELNRFENAIQYSLKSAKDTLSMVEPLLSRAFTKQAELDYKMKRLELVEKALESDNPDNTISELMDENHAEIEALQAKMVVEKQGVATNIQSVPLANRNESVVTIGQDPVVDMVMQRIHETVAATNQGCELLNQKASQLSKRKSKKKACMVLIDGVMQEAIQIDLF